MKETLRLILTLSIICFIAGALLAGVDKVTQAPIQRANSAKKLCALQEVLPACDNQPDQNACTVEHNGQTWTFYVARNANTYAGTAVETTSSIGYGGDITIMLGISAEGQTETIAILKQTETPGLGANIETDNFKSNFKQKPIESTNWTVKKDGGDIDQITAATISSRAVADAVNNAIEAYLANQEKIKATRQ